MNGVTSGYANEAAVGTAGLALDSFSSTATTATSVVTLTGAAVTVQPRVCALLERRSLSGESDDHQ